ncbi:MAG: FAD-dependent oxidoreductase [Saprospiraceae bacterium]|nr:FAD-dependent oxidoreductase [Saprospiraceae bacterium]
MHAVIIGAGIIGLSAARYLQKDGWKVTVLEKGDLSDNCSFGNMGYLSPSHFVPLAAAGSIDEGVLWMFDKKSPFYVRPRPSWQLIDWGIKFARACTATHVQRSARPLAELLFFSKKLFEDWAAAGDLDFELTQRGCLVYYQTEKKEREEQQNLRLASELGLKTEVLGREQVQTIEPELKPDVRGGVLYKDDAHLYPNALMQQLPAWLEKRGVRIVREAEVTGFDRENGKISAVYYREQSSQNQRHLDVSDAVVVLAAGSWSPRIAKMAGEYLPLMPGKGYSMTIEGPQKKLNYPCILAEAKVALTPWPNRLRIGSTMEIGPINDKILLPRVQGILEAVPRFFPGYRTDAAFQQLADPETLRTQLREKVWFGFRPVSADGLPYIGFARKTSNLLLATGHAMLGLSMGAGTGKLIAELAGGKATSMAIEAFNPGRY